MGRDPLWDLKKIKLKLLKKTGRGVIWVEKHWFRACFKFCEYLKKFWQALQVWTMKVCQRNTFLGNKRYTL
jgi:hypothetical protein